MQTTERPYRLLVADNDLTFLSLVKSYLQSEGYYVLTATSPEEAEQMLNTHYVHMATFDLRLINDNEPRDRSGLVLAKRVRFPAVRIILTRFGEYDDAIEAMRQDARGVPAVVDFVDKKKPLDEALLPSIRHNLAAHLRLNRELHIELLPHGTSFSQMVLQMLPDTEPACLADHAYELEDVFRLRFYDDDDNFEQIIVEPLPVRREQRLWFKVTAYTKHGRTRQYLCVCGDREIIRREREAYKAYSPAAEMQIHSTAFSETLHFGLTAYRLANNENDQLLPLATFYEQVDSDIFLVTLANIFENLYDSPTRQAIHPVESPLFTQVTGEALYGDAQGDRLRQAIEAISAQMNARWERTVITLAEKAIEFQLHESVLYPNPLYYHHTLMTRQVERQQGVVHGDLRLDSVLISQHAYLYILDYASSRTLSRLYDYLSLEMALRLYTVDAASSLTTRHEFEWAVLGEYDPQSLPVSLKRTAQAIQYLRELALSQTGHNAIAYEEDLLVHTLVYLLGYPTRMPRLLPADLLRYAHCLLLAAILCSRLQPEARSITQLPEQAMSTLWLDAENEQVWVKGYSLELTPLEYRILAFLYQHRGALCTLQDIAEQGLGEVYSPDQGDIGRLHTAMSRLRLKLKDYSDVVEIETRRGRGYQLNVL